MSVFDALVGQDAAIEDLTRAAAAAADIVAGRSSQPGAMTHAWLFTGPAGSGRSVAARALAAAVQCDRQPAGCCSCPSWSSVLASATDGTGSGSSSRIRSWMSRVISADGRSASRTR